MPDRGVPPQQQDPQRLNDLLAECILVLEQQGDVAMEAVLALHPDMADRARSRLRSLRASGLLGEPAKDPERIGPYRVRQRLGAGGMGTVYLADQDDEIERRVAIKVIKPGMDSREVLARFALERQALAMLDHQNIAKVLDAGQTEDGRPYLVMEYVSGLPITRYCDERRLQVHERIEMFCLVCEAVQHAHHKGLIHRDLKPSNILVADREGRPWPIVIDFGVAKSLGTGLSAHSLVTVRGRVLGTPEYMSPEQAANDMDVDTRADVFSLGVVLYELLTGTLPIDSSTLRRAESGDLSRILRNSDTPAPSRRISSLGRADAGMAQMRQTNGSRLRRHLRGDLDWITLRALERDRNRRYGMPGELAADLRRHLRNEPVLAGPPSAFYRWRKFFARNRLQTGSAAVVLLTLVAGLWVSISAYRVADASARQSDADFENAMGAVERLVFFGDQGLVDEPQMDDVRRHLLQDALGFYQKVAEGHSEEPRLQLRVAHATARTGRLHFQLGDYGPALSALDLAKRRFEDLHLDPPPTNAIAFVDSLRGQTLLSFGRTAEAEAALRSAADAFRGLGSEPSAESQVARNRLVAMGQLARVVRGRDPQAARREFEDALAIAQPWLSGDVVDLVALPLALHIAVQHADLLLDLGDAAGARARAEPLRARVVAEWAQRSEPQRQELANSCNELGALYRELGVFDVAEQLLGLAAAQQRWLCATHPAQTYGHSALGVVLSSLASVQLQQNQVERAQATAAECVQVLEGLFARSKSSSHQALLGKAILNQARILGVPRSIAGEVDGAAVEKAMGRGIDLLESLPRELRQARDTQLPLTLAWSLRAMNYQAAGEHAAAVAAMERAVTGLANLSAGAPELVDIRRELQERRCNLAQMLLDARQWQRALDVAVLVDLPAPGSVDGAVADNDLSLLVCHLRMRACAGLGDIDGVLAAVRRPGATDLDWNGARIKAEALLLLVEQLSKDHPQRSSLLAEARNRLQEALTFGETMGADMAPMVAVMSAQTQDILVRVERVAGDLAAASVAAEAAVAGYEPSLRMRDSAKNRDRLCQAGEVWLQLLFECGDNAGLANGIERLAAAFDQHGVELLRLAEWWAKLVVLHATDPVAAGAWGARGVALLRRCLELGSCDAAALAQSASLAPLRAHADFASLIRR